MKNFAFVLLFSLLAACGSNQVKEEKISNVIPNNQASANSELFNTQFSLFLQRRIH